MRYTFVLTYFISKQFEKHIHVHANNINIKNDRKEAIVNIDCFYCLDDVGLFPVFPFAIS